MANGQWLASAKGTKFIPWVKRAIGHKLLAIVGQSQKITNFAPWNNY